MAANVTSNTTSGMNYTEPSASQLVCFMLFIVTFLFGLVINTLYIWVLCFRMKRNVSTTWFLHVLTTHLFFIFTMPFLAVYLLLYPRWVFGVFMCKFLNFLISFSMYGTVFCLTAISIDRYFLVFRPHFYRKHMTVRQTSVICLFLWSLALLCSSPYLVFRQVLQDNNISICINDYTLGGKLGTGERLKTRVKWGMFYFRLLLGFLFPFVIIVICYIKLALKINKDNLAKSNKPYKIISISIVTFFISWTPYHVWYGMSVGKGPFQETTLEVMKIITTCSSCFNSCFTPILYLFIVENFRKVFKKSTISIIEAVLMDVFNRNTEERSEPSSLSIPVNDICETN